MKPIFKEALTQKISNEYQFQVLLRQYDKLTNYGGYMLGNDQCKGTWWAHREQLRLTHKVYETTKVVEHINSSNPVHAHISVQDPKRVAYTPDKSFGEQDRQLVINLGKLITRLYPGMKDEEVQKLVQMHEAELSDEVEFIEGFEAIDAAYKSMGNIGACMSHEDGRYSGMSPLHAYDVPGIKLAVIRNHEGKISARTMVYEASETDKRFIRVYPGGEETITRRLQKRGYVSGTWHGAKFKKVAHEKGQEMYPGLEVYCMPYLDGRNGMGGESKSMVALLDGELVAVPLPKAQKLRKIKHHAAVCCTDTAGYVAFENLNTDEYMVNDFITGAKISRLDDLIKLKVGGEYHYTAVTPPGDTYVNAQTMEDGGSVRLWMLKTEVYTPPYRWEIPVDKAFLGRFGYAQLDESLYGPDRIESTSGTSETHAGRHILRADAVKVLVGPGNMQCVHRSEIVVKGKGKHVRLANDIYALQSVKLYVTPGGRKVHPDVHDIVEQYDGMYEFRRNTRTVRVLGKIVHVPKSGSANYGVGSAIYRRIQENHAAYARNLHLRGYPLVTLATNIHEAASDTYSRYSGYYYDSGGISHTIRVDKDHPADVQLEAIKRVAEYKQTEAAWLAHSICSVIYAEMEAVEPGQLDNDMKRLAMAAQEEEAKASISSRVVNIPETVDEPEGDNSSFVREWARQHLTYPETTRGAPWPHQAPVITISTL